MEDDIETNWTLQVLLICTEANDNIRTFQLEGTVPNYRCDGGYASLMSSKENVTGVY